MTGRQKRLRAKLIARQWLAEVALSTDGASMQWRTNDEEMAIEELQILGIRLKKEAERLAKKNGIELKPLK